MNCTPVKVLFIECSGKTLVARLVVYIYNNSNGNEKLLKFKLENLLIRLIVYLC